MPRPCPQCGVESIRARRLLLWPRTACRACGATVRLSGLFLGTYLLAVGAFIAFAVVFATAKGDGAPVPAYIFLECLAVMGLVALYGGLVASGGKRD